MIKPEQIPDEVAFALLDIYALWLGDTDQARAAIAAVINAWPGMEIEMVFVEEDYLILPLPTKNPDAEG